MTMSPPPRPKASPTPGVQRGVPLQVQASRRGRPLQVMPLLVVDIASDTSMGAAEDLPAKRAWNEDVQASRPRRNIHPK